MSERPSWLRADSAAAYYPTSRISPTTLMLRSVPGRGNLIAMATDTVYNSPPQIVSCWATVGDNGLPKGVQVEHPDARP